MSQIERLGTAVAVGSLRSVGLWHSEENVRAFGQALLVPLRLERVLQLHVPSFQEFIFRHAQWRCDGSCTRLIASLAIGLDVSQQLCNLAGISGVRPTDSCDTISSRFI